MTGGYVSPPCLPHIHVLTLVDFVIDLARNGEMQTLLSRMGSLSLNCAQYYAAQVVDAIDYMHSKGVIHR